MQQGVSSILREWTLQGSDLRELVVPELEQQAVAAAERRAELDPASELFDLVADSAETRDDHSPAAELAHLPPVTLPLPLPILSKPENPMHPASLFADNQLINSWIKRHQRAQPMRMTGDPELGLNESQTQAVAMALGERLSLIQGVSGHWTGDQDECSLTRASVTASWDGQVSDNRVDHHPPEAPFSHPSTDLVGRSDACLGRSFVVAARARRPQPAQDRTSGQSARRFAAVDDRGSSRTTPVVAHVGTNEDGKRRRSCQVAGVSSGQASLAWFAVA